MSYSPYEPAPPERDRWGLNLPLAIGVVVVFLIAVVAWVLIDATRGDEEAIDPTLPPPAPTSAPPETVVVPTSTTPPLLPTTAASTPVQSTTPPPVPTPTPPPTIPVTPPPPSAPPVPTPTQPPATLSPLEPGAVPGDLGVPGRPMVRPVCAGYITVIASNAASSTSAAGIQQLLEQYPEAQYLRTDQSCASLDRSGQGEPIYVVYLGPFPEAADACQARAQGPDGAYARQLSPDVGPDHSVACT